MQKSVVWLIRHGESHLNAGSSTSTPELTALTALGHTQAETAARQIIAPPDLIIQSPLLRAKQSAAPIIKQWHNTPIEIWPIQEFVYISPEKFIQYSVSERKKFINDYWECADPFFCDGGRAESFATFIQRVQDFSKRLSTLKGFSVVVGHGQFFKAYQLGLIHGFSITSEWMKQFRQKESTNPIKNSEILKLEF